MDSRSPLQSDEQTDAPERECAGGLASLGNVNSPPGDPCTFALHGIASNAWLSLMPQLEWNDIDFLDFFAVEPTVEDYAVSHNYEVERNGLRLLFTVWQDESVIQASVFRGDTDDALFTFAAYVRAGARFINDKRGRYLEIADCIIAPNRFWYIDSGNPFDRERFPIAVTVTVAVDPDIRIAFVNFEPRT